MRPAAYPDTGKDEKGEDLKAKLGRSAMTSSRCIEMIRALARDIPIRLKLKDSHRANMFPGRSGDIPIHLKLLMGPLRARYTSSVGPQDGRALK